MLNVVLLNVVAPLLQTFSKYGRKKFYNIGPSLMQDPTPQTLDQVKNVERTEPQVHLCWEENFWKKWKDKKKLFWKRIFAPLEKFYHWKLNWTLKGATTLSITTFSIATFSITTFSKTTFSIRTFSTGTFSIRTFSITTFSITTIKRDTQLNGRIMLCWVS